MDRSSNVCESDSVSSSSAASSTDIFFDELMHTVHTLTSDIENDFEKLIDQHGRNGLHAVRSKVISALELLLETCNNQKDNRQVVKELHYKVRLLESEKAVNCIGYENLLAEMEKDYKKKLEEQLKFKAHLLQENEKLSSALSSALQRERDSKEDDKQSEIELILPPSEAEDISDNADSDWSRETEYGQRIPNEEHKLDSTLKEVESSRPLSR